MNRWVFKTVAAVLAMLLLSPSFSTDAAHAALPVQGVVFQLPLRLGLVTACRPASRLGAPTIIVIQDICEHYPTQEKILRILGFLEARHLLEGPIAVEGHSGPFDTTPLAAAPSGRYKTDRVDYFMQTGALSADEAFAVLHNDGHRLVGVDDRDLVRLHQTLSQKALAQRETLGHQLMALEDRIAVLQLSPTDQRVIEDMTADLERLMQREATLSEARAMSRRLPAFIVQVRKTFGPAFAEPLQKSLQLALVSYQVALRRDVPLAQNTLALAGTASSPTILIAGGDHTQGLLEQFQKAGAGYAVITPILASNVRS